MARIAGVDLPKSKRGEIGLTYIFGIGRTTAQYILNKSGITYDKKVHEWNDDELTSIRNIITNEVAAISVGVVENTPLLDLKYDEDSRAEVDMNVDCTGDGRFIEVQGTAEREPFSREQMDSLLALATKGLETLVAIQRETVEQAKD